VVFKYYLGGLAMDCGLSNSGHTILGVVIALVCVYAKSRFSLSNSRKINKENLKGFLQAIFADVNTLKSVYMADVGQEVEKIDGSQPFYMYYPITSNYFVVYDQNAHLLGELRDERMRGLIISIYTKAKILKDSFLHNNHEIKRLNDYKEELTLHDKPSLQERADSLERGLVQYANKIKVMHDDLLQEVNQLLEELPKSIKSNKF